jgi:hypothetical protein
MRKLIVTTGSILLLAACVHAQETGNDDAAIKKTALDYIEGWYEGDAARMESALHPELAKRMILTDPKTGRSQIQSYGSNAVGPEHSSRRRQ